MREFKPIPYVIGLVCGLIITLAITFGVLKVHERNKQSYDQSNTNSGNHSEKIVEDGVLSGNPLVVAIADGCVGKLYMAESIGGVENFH